VAAAAFGWSLGARSAEAVPLFTRPEDQARFRITEFATGLAFPTSMVALDDGSLLVATNTGGPQAWIGDNYIFTSPSAAIVRLVDADGDGEADGPAQPVASGLPGLVSSIRRVGNLVMAVSAREGAQAITLWRTGSTTTDPLAPAGTLSLSLPANYLHPPCTLAARSAPGGGVELLFNVGGQFNATSGTATVGISSSGGASFVAASGTVQLAPESIHRLVLTDSGTSITVSEPVQIARGLRNAAGMVFAANGDLLFNDNGADDPNNSAVSLSADELNVIRSSDLGITVPNFGFAGTYIDYATGVTVGPTTGITPPLAAFRPLDGEKSEGAVELALAPGSFPAEFLGGVFVPFSGVFNAGGAANDENPLIFVDPATGSYFHFLANGQMGHPNGLLATADALYLSDLSVTGAFGGVREGVAADESGTIYRITYVPEPGTAALAPCGAMLLAWRRRKRKKAIDHAGA
jgi:glucose/arabinose dehydrogenase